MSANETEKGLSWGKWQILHYFKFQLQKKVILPILIHVHINIKFGSIFEANNFRISFN